MSQSDEHLTSESPAWAMRVGAVLTILIVVFFAFIAFFPVGSGEDRMIRIVHLWHEPFNVWGDTLAGIAGVLAFLWIIITVHIQSRELRAQQEQLALTREELAETRKATQDMALSQADQVNILKEQGAIFEDEQRQRREDRAEKLLEQLLEELVLLARNEDELTRTWVIFPLEGDMRSTKRWFFYASRMKLETPTLDQQLQWVARHADAHSDYLISLEEKGQLDRKSTNYEYYADADQILNEILELKDQLGDHHLARLRKLKVQDLQDALQRILKADIWAVSEDCAE